MTKTKIAIFAITSILLSAAMMAQEVSAEGIPLSIETGGTGSTEAIPDWVDQNFRWYAEKQISQTDLINSLEFLVTERIILLPSVVQTAEAQVLTETLEKQIEILEGGPQALKALEPNQLEKVDCGPKPDFKSPSCVCCLAFV